MLQLDVNPIFKAFHQMTGLLLGLEWAAISSLMDRRGLDAQGWSELHEALMVIEAEALATLREFAQKPKSGE